MLDNDHDSLALLLFDLGGLSDYCAYTPITGLRDPDPCRQTLKFKNSCSLAYERDSLLGVFRVVFFPVTLKYD